jgi:hypothetical protein
MASRPEWKLRSRGRCAVYPEHVDAEGCPWRSHTCTRRLLHRKTERANLVVLIGDVAVNAPLATEGSLYICVNLSETERHPSHVSHTRGMQRRASVSSGQLSEGHSGDGTPDSLGTLNAAASVIHIGTQNLAAAYMAGQSWNLAKSLPTTRLRCTRHKRRSRGTSSMLPMFGIHESRHCSVSSAEPAPDHRSSRSALLG